MIKNENIEGLLNEVVELHKGKCDEILMLDSALEKEIRRTEYWKEKYINALSEIERLISKQKEST